jgi:predicted nucleic acid-binding protein
MTIPVKDALSGVKRLGIDTMVFIYFVEQHPTYHPIVRQVFSMVDRGVVEGFSSTITFAEVLTIPKRLGAQEIENAYRQILLDSENFSMIDVTAEVAERAADLRATYKLKTPDALQIATAWTTGCDLFLTNDRALAKVNEIRVLILEDLSP